MRLNSVGGQFVQDPGKRHLEHERAVSFDHFVGAPPGVAAPYVRITALGCPTAVRKRIASSGKVTVADRPSGSTIRSRSAAF